MIQTLEAKIDADGRVSLLEPVKLPAGRRALVTVLDESPAPDSPPLEGSGLECALMSEASLAEIWDTPEEDAAWQHLGELPLLADDDYGDEEDDS